MLFIWACVLLSMRKAPAYVRKDMCVGCAVNKYDVRTCIHSNQASLYYLVGGCGSLWSFNSFTLPLHFAIAMYDPRDCNINLTPSVSSMAADLIPVLSQKSKLMSNEVILQVMWTTDDHAGLGTR